ncbi:MAG: hypothetical protein LQ349_007062 [Xanthoria aureola]|nr:MAG: hypothetical protein LQ349_007062 [Xanthoria aureola]
MAIRALLRTSAPYRRVISNRRSIATLPDNPHIYIFDDPASLHKSHILSLLPTNPPKPDLAIGTTTAIPATPASVKENHRFLDIVQTVIGIHAHQDPDIISQARAMASSGGSNLGSGASMFPSQRRQRQARQGPSYGGGGGAGGDGAGGASSQGGTGGGGRGGHIHVYDYRHPPDYGRIPDPEDIFGSLEVDAGGGFVEGHGRYQRSVTYRLCTRDGILGLSPFLKERLVERLRLEEEMVG